MIPFQCRLVGSELNLASTFIAKAISGLVHCARYNKSPIAFRYGTWGSSIFSSISLGEMDYSYDQDTERPLEYLVDERIVYWNASGVSQHMLIDGSKFHQKYARFGGWDNILFSPNLSSQIPS